MMQSELSIASLVGTGAAPATGGSGGEGSPAAGGTAEAATFLALLAALLRDGPALDAAGARADASAARFAASEPAVTSSGDAASSSELPPKPEAAPDSRREAGPSPTALEQAAAWLALALSLPAPADAASAAVETAGRADGAAAIQARAPGRAEAPSSTDQARIPPLSAPEPASSGHASAVPGSQTVDVSALLASSQARAAPVTGRPVDTQRPNETVTATAPVAPLFAPPAATEVWRDGDASSPTPPAPPAGTVRDALALGARAPTGEPPAPTGSANGTAGGASVPGDSTADSGPITLGGAAAPEELVAKTGADPAGGAFGSASASAAGQLSRLLGDLGVRSVELLPHVGPGDRLRRGGEFSPPRAAGEALAASASDADAPVASGGTPTLRQVGGEAIPGSPADGAASPGNVGSAPLASVAAPTSVAAAPVSQVAATAGTGDEPAAPGHRREGGTPAAVPLTATVNDAAGVWQPAAHDAASQAAPQPVAAQVVRGVEAALRRPGHTVRLALEPEGLGAVDLRITLGTGGVRVQIATELADTHQLLQSATPQLSQTLLQRGVPVEQVLVQLTGGQVGGGDLRQSRSPSPAASRHGRPRIFGAESTAVERVDNGLHRVDVRI